MSNDRGETWSRLGKYSPQTLTLLVDPVRPGVVYAGTTTGVYVKRPATTTWQAVGPAGRHVRWLAADAKGRRLYAGIEGGGVAATRLPLPAASTRRSTVSSRSSVSPTAGLVEFTRSDNGAYITEADGSGVRPLWRGTRGVTDLAWSTGGLPPVWRATGPEGGSAQFAVASGVVYAGTSDGVYASTTWGSSWHRRSRGLPAGPVGVAVDPQRPRTLYASTERGIWKSVDGARSWRQLSDFNGRPRIFVAPSDSRVLYACVWGWGLMSFSRSLDGGRSWTQLKLPPIEDVAVDAYDAAKLYGASDAGLYVSVNHGSTWLRVLGDSDTVAVDPRARNTVYAGSPRGEIYRSDDGGRRWRVIGRLEAPILYRLYVDPPAAVLWATSNWGVHRSTDAGRTWRFRGPWPRKAFILAFAVDPTGSGTLLAGDSETVSRSVDGGVTWRPAVGGLVATSTTAIDARLSTAVYAVTAGRVWRSGDHGASWQPAGDLPIWAKAVAVDPSRATTLYVGGDEIAKSEDGGRTWERLGEHYTTALAVDPARPATVYAGTSLGVHKSTNGGRTWQWASRGLGAPEGPPGPPFFFIVIDPSRPEALYAAMNTVNPETGVRGKVFKTTDGARQWRQLTGPNLPDAPVSGLAIDPRDPDTVYLATLAGLRRSDDGGETWQQAGELVAPPVGIAVDPRRPAVYTATAEHVFVSTDRGASWSRVSTVLRGSVSGLAVDAEGTRLYALTRNHGVSVARLPLTGPVDR